jgi:flagellar biosynthesis GTPase FlhF
VANRLFIVVATAISLIGVTLITVVPVFAASANEKKWFETYVVANGGCHAMTAYSEVMALPSQSVGHGVLDVDLFGKPVLKWSDDDIATVLGVYRDCEAKELAALGRVGRPDKISRFWDTSFKMFESRLRGTITTARNLDAQRKAQQQSKIDQSREQAKGDQEVADETSRVADLEKSKLQEATKEADEARRARQEAEQKLAGINSAITAQQSERQQQLAQMQELDRQADISKLGYQSISVESFVLDGRDLAARTAKLAITGVYIREGNLDVLYADMRALMMTRQGVNQPNVSLLTDHTSREFREHLLKCQSDYASAQRGCAVTVLGRATTCTLTNAFGTAREEPCVAVEDGRQ